MENKGKKKITSQIKNTKQKYGDTNNVYLLNGFKPTDGYTLYRYLSFSKLKQILDGKLIFVSPSVWSDPFEHYFLDFVEEKLDKQIACLCFSYRSTTNEDAMWKLFDPNNGEKMFRVSFNFDNFMKQLDNYAERENCEIYVSKAIYGFNRKELLNLQKSEIQRFKSVEQLLSLMCLKRDSFSHENEVRIFIVKNGLWEDSGNKKLEVPLTQLTSELIPQIIIGPIPQFPKEDLRRKTYNKFQEIETKEYEKYIVEKIPKCKVLHSMLNAEIESFKLT